MTGPEFDRLLRRVWQTGDEEIDCSECFDLLPRAVDLDLAGQTEALPRFHQHLEQCEVCREEFETLRDLVRRDADPGPPPAAPA